MDSYSLQTGFFPGESGSVHVTLFLPLAASEAADSIAATTAGPARWVLYFPAFAEEMNKSRSLVARTARSLAERGVAVIVPDLYGTGDSDGEFAQASWDIWLEDQLSLAGWAREQGASELVFWGLRSGCLLAAEAATKMAAPPRQLLLWQPVHSGKQHMTQFLRLRMASSLTNGGAGRESASDVKQRLVEDGVIRVGGYQLGASLFQGIEDRQLSAMAVPVSTGIHVLEVSAMPGSTMNRVTQTQLDQWREKGHEPGFSQVMGDSFWSTQELGVAPALTDKTLESLTQRPASRGVAGSRLSGLGRQSASGCLSLVIPCAGSSLVGIAHAPGASTEASDIGVLIVVGGPQYRVGSHRQFVSLACGWAGQGFPVLRFDYRGMGDSDGVFKGFTGIADDIRSAVDALMDQHPGVRRVVIWGLCDAATAAVAYAPTDSRVAGVVLANPWVYSEEGAAKAYLKHYYLQRLLSKSFWSKVVSGHFKPAESLSSIARLTRKVVNKAFAPGSARPGKEGAGANISNKAAPGRSGQGSLAPDVDLVEAFERALSSYSGNVLLILSGRDLTAAEFLDAERANPRLRRALATPRVSRLELPDVDHTFSRPEWRRQVEVGTLEFLRQL